MRYKFSVHNWYDERQQAPGIFEEYCGQSSLYRPEICLLTALGVDRAGREPGITVKRPRYEDHSFTT